MAFFPLLLNFSQAPTTAPIAAFLSFDGGHLALRSFPPGAIDQAPPSTKGLSSARSCETHSTQHRALAAASAAAVSLS